MHKVNYQKLKTLSEKLDLIINGPSVEEEIYENFSNLLDKLRQDIQFNSNEYGDDFEKMIKLCFVMKLKVESKISNLREEISDMKYFN